MRRSRSCRRRRRAPCLRWGGPLEPGMRPGLSSFRHRRALRPPNRDDSVTRVADGEYGACATRLGDMPSKTAARSGARSSRSKTGSRGGSRPARHKPARRHNPSAISSAGATVGRGVRAGWVMLAKGAGSTARSVGRARDLEPGHRRDGIALALLGIAVVIAASSWFDAARPVGQSIDTFLRVLIGSAVVLVPLVLAWIAVVLMRTEPDPEARPRLILGAAMTTLPVLGLWHLWAGSPMDPAGRQRAAGFLGFAIGGPLYEGLAAWIVAALVFIGALFCLLFVIR